MNINTNNIINALVLGSENMGQDVIVIKSNGPCRITCDMVKESVKEQEDIKALFYEFKSNVMHEAYEPFLGWVKEIYESSGEETPEDFMEKCDVYPLHREMLCRYIRDGVCIRKEPVILYEKDYDRKRFMESLTNIMKSAAGDGKLLMVFGRIHLAGYSTIRYLNSLFQNCEGERLALLCTYDSTVGIPGYMNNIWEEMVRTVEERNLGMILQSQNAGTVLPGDKETAYFKPLPEAVDTYIRRIHTMLETLAIEQAVYYLDEITYKFKHEKEEIDRDKRISLDELYTFAYLYAEKYQNTLMVCDRVKKMETGRLDVKFNCNYAMSLAQCFLGQEVTAMSLAKTCQAAAVEMHDEQREFLAKMLCGIVHLKCFGHVIIDSDESVNYMDEQFITEMENRGYLNHVAYFCIYGFERKQKYFMGEHPEGHLKFFQKGLQIIEQIGNDKFVIEAYGKCAMMYSIVGNMDEVENNYKKCIEALRRLDSSTEEADIYNGLGYNNMLRDNFEHANSYYNQALEIYYKLGNPVMASETLYNMGINALMAEDFKRCCEYITAAIQLLDYFGVYKPRVCNRAKLYGLVAVSHIKLGNGYKAQIYMEKMERIFRHIFKPDGEPVYDFWDDELFYYYLGLGLVLQKEGRLEEALQKFERAGFHMDRSGGSKLVSYPLLVNEHAEVLRILGRTEERKELLEQCLQYNIEKQKSVTVAKLKALLADKKTKKPEWKLEINTAMDMILSMARELGAERALTIKNKNIDFLSSWQEMFLAEDLKEEEMIEKSMLTLKNFFGLDRILLFQIDKNGQKDIKYCDSEISMKPGMRDRIVDFFVNRKSSFVVSRIDGNFEEYEEIISNFGMNSVVSMIGIPLFSKDVLQTVFITYQIVYDNFSSAEVMLNKSDLHIMVLGLRQLMNEIYRAEARKRIREMNDELKTKNMLLENLAQTDSLTGLLNRQGFNKIVDERIDEEDDEMRYLIVMYIDLDNFKYCNDTFGHDVGDMVLQLFAKLFKTIIGKSGYVVRYGGDEFVIVAKNQNPDYGQKVAESIFEKLKENHAFADKISENVGRTVDIPDKNKLSCSIGIAVDKAKNVDMISDLLKHADSSLYKVKKTTKNNYEVWKS